MYAKISTTIQNPESKFVVETIEGRPSAIKFELAENALESLPAHISLWRDTLTETVGWHHKHVYCDESRQFKSKLSRPATS